MKTTTSLFALATVSTGRVLFAGAAFASHRTARHYPRTKQFLSSLAVLDEETNVGSSLPLPIKGVIFDMDGTLVKPCIDFPDMRRRIYDVASEDLSLAVTEGCILELVTQLSEQGQERCKEVFQDIEAKAIRDMAFMDGLNELLVFLDENKIRRAVLTRNVQNSIVAMHERLRDWHDVTTPFEPAVARDTTRPEQDTLITAKPAPDGILYICNQWQCDPSQVIMVGDSDKDDIVAAYRAGCGASVLLMDPQKVHDNNSGNDHDSDLVERTPTVQLDSLVQLHELLSRHMEQTELTSAAALQSAE
jgi:HAD superfamily hydrolase (TIGR01549 family)